LKTQMIIIYTNNTLTKSSCPRYQTQMTLLCYGFQTHPRFQWSVCLTFPLT
jgi:hypothetical protein